MSGLIAIVGRPNVGKSALFNRIVGRRIAIVHDQPGVTRDRITAQADWHGRPFTLVDTGGIGLLRGERTEDPIAQAAFTQVNIAIESADVIVLVVNLQDGLVPLDREVAARLRQSGKPVVVAANKADTVELEAQTSDFNAMGFDIVLPVSAMHSRGIAPLVDAAVKRLPKEAPRAVAPPAPVPPVQAELAPGESAPPAVEGAAPIDGAAPAKASPKHPAPPLKIAIVGRPNVGKSSLINALTKSERVIVSPIPGTTRDSVDVPFEVETEGRRESYVLIDTAGLRKKRRVDETLEFFSVKRAEESIERADLVILVLDAEMGITEQDKKIGDRIVDAHKACLIVVNKWDLYAEAVEDARKNIEKKELKKPRKGPLIGPARGSLNEFARWVQENLFFLDYAPVIFTSAQTGFHLDRLLEAVRFVTAELQKQVPTALLNRTLADCIERKQPVSAMGSHLRFFYATQVQQSPPTFLLFVNRDELFSDSYTRYLTSSLRKAFGYEGCPIVLVAKARPQRIEPKRTPKPKRHGRPDPRSRESRSGGARSRNARARKDHRKRS